MKTSKNKLLRKFKNLSRVLTNNSSMLITFGGTGAYHLPGHINLPAGDFSDDDFVTMSLGYCDHELGHEQYTDDNFYQLASGVHPFVVRLLNALDDLHQENRMFADFRGTRISIRKLVELCKVKGVFCLPSEDNHLQVLKAWVLYKGRSELLEQPVADLFQKTDAMLLNLFGDSFYRKCHHILRSDVLNSLGTTEACFNVAENIWNVFVEWMEEQERPEEDTQEASGGIEGSDDSDGVAEGSQDHSEGNVGSMVSVGLKAKIADEMDEMSSENEHELIIKIINAMAADCQESVEPIKPLGLARRNIAKETYDESLIDSDSQRLIAKMKNPLKRVFHDQNYVNYSYRNRGKSISSARLAGVAVGNSKVFESESIHRSPNAAVGLLVDRSSSMDEDDMKMANSVAYSLSNALEGIHGVESIVGYYPVTEDGRRSLCRIVKPFEVKANINNFVIDCAGGTPTAEAICTMTSILSTRPEPRKLLFVVTDGDPNCINSTREAIEEAQAVGVRVFGIGIKGDVEGFESADFEAIYSKEELLNALTKKLKHAFI
ncbi:VWA domain-containing protein [Shewanella algae]|uniref:VWA domain-containing protein n=1 Tax=Shewanella algae TaxID=38313 RepID=UPI001AADBC31|nr:VWA domain-containing protein [Shewanella algae]MBO2656044.1 VWA domain-containing protein [Shewanella algae]